MKNRWVHLFLCLLVGSIVGREVGIREAYAHQMAYSQALEDSYVNSPIWTLVTSMSTIAKAEDKMSDSVISSNGMILRGAFLTLVELHKSGHYKAKDAKMRKNLEKAKAFMTERRSLFIDQKLVSLSSFEDRMKHPDKSFEEEDNKATDQARDQLQKAFDYVDGLGK